MWWKICLAMIAGFFVGMVVSSVAFRSTYADLIDVRSQEMAPWSSANKDWREFSVFLRYGGRQSLRGAAHLAAEHGMSEFEVRSLFGPPDHVAVGRTELGPYPGIYTEGKAGAYFYKVGPCAVDPRPNCLVFVVVFDASGKLIDRQNLGVFSDDRLATFDDDTRIERRIAP